MARVCRPPGCSAAARPLHHIRGSCSPPTQSQARCARRPPPGASLSAFAPRPPRCAWTAAPAGWEGSSRVTASEHATASARGLDRAPARAPVCTAPLRAAPCVIAARSSGKHRAGRRPPCTRGLWRPAARTARHAGCRRRPCPLRPTAQVATQQAAGPAEKYGVFRLSYDVANVRRRRTHTPAPVQQQQPPAARRLAHASRPARAPPPPRPACPPARSHARRRRRRTPP